MDRAVVLFTASLLAALACGEPAPGGDAGEGSSIARACQIDADEPRTIAELVEHIDALPHPVTIPCLLASLPRPLSLVATTSTFSVQPAMGPDNPRIFVLGEGLVLAVLPAGEGSELLEISEWVSPTQSIKAELEFPVDAPLSAEAPYDLSYNLSVTRCGLCHPNEYPAPQRPGAYISEAMRPAPASLVEVTALHDSLERCDWAEDRPRCELLHALLDFGPVEQGAFSDEVRVFFE
jgi:hypothetical protein